MTMINNPPILSWIQITDLDQNQNLTTSKLGQVPPSLKISAKSACNLLSNPASKPTDKQINASYHITSLLQMTIT